MKPPAKLRNFIQIRRIITRNELHIYRIFVQHIHHSHYNQLFPCTSQSYIQLSINQRPIFFHQIGEEFQLSAIIHTKRKKYHFPFTPLITLHRIDRYIHQLRYSFGLQFFPYQSDLTAIGSYNP